MSGQATIYKHKKSWMQEKAFVAQSNGREKKEQKKKQREDKRERNSNTHTHRERERLSAWL